MDRDRPLDGVGSVKLKFGLLVGLSVVAATLVAEIGGRAGVPAWLSVPVTVAAALAVTQWLARGMTSPLREMTHAASRMARGDYSARVRATSADEVGRLARAFNTMAQDLHDADDQRRQLLATVSHELRTPLAAQRALLENLVDGVVRPDDDALQTALTQSERLSDLVGDLLDLSRVDAGAAPLDVGPLAVSDLIDRAVAEAGSHGRDVTITAEVCPPDLTVHADAARLHQVVANLLDNATRHTPAGGTVTVRAETLPGGSWALEVTDTGDGIPPEHAEEVFTRFWSDQHAGGGTGLGLAIARWVCELHGGTITALPPDDGGGGRVRAVLPRLARPRAAAPSAPPPEDHAPLPAPLPTGRQHAAGEEVHVSTTASVPDVPAQGGARTAAAPSFAETLFGGLWPEGGPRTAQGALLASLGIGALAAVVLPGRSTGVALLLVLLLAGVLVLRLSPRRSRAWTLASAALCLGLGSLTVLRAAEWVTVLALLAAGLLVTTALTDARRTLAVLAGPAAWVLSAVRGLPLLGRTITATSDQRLLWPVLRTAAVSLVALVVFGGLFASGDAVFGSWVSALVPDLAWDSAIQRTFVLVAVAGVVLAACYLALNPPRVDRLALPAAQPVTRAWEWLVPVGMVVAVLAGFVLAQATAMWGGHDYVRRQTGMSYADYVHQGFGQLTVATTLTLVTVALAVHKAPRATARDRLVLRVALGVLCVLTLVVVASALFRMAVYQQAFGFTVLRVLVDVFEAWLGLLVLLVMVAGVRWSAWWLPRAALASGAALLLAVGLANPEGWVARQNIERYQETGKIDTWYLASLGPDAVPAVVDGLPEELQRCALPAAEDARPDDLLEWNLGRSRAAELVPSGAPADRSDCP
ncbi:signal transduction histidine kinase [Georgenia soli]|uniref:Signal transduction histidine-protein kinase/phosphatase MprB n=1 Tax=Georgenia soli TaxID=638953 RepID=A0A2A9ET18_9MICO|nr:DUF4153 domain-containing protein [Georgenia soli]PFG41319.1 signal transduction histidine kinase [Georgenia soli]